MRTVILLSLCFLVVLPSSASASPVDPTKSSCGLVLVGNTSGADMGNAYQVTVRDVGNVPVLGVDIAIRFLTSPAAPLAQQESGTTVDCTNRVLHRVSGPGGTTTFHARTAGFDNSGVIEVRGNGILLAHILARSTDLDGNGATDLADLNAFRERFLFNPTAPESDFNQDGATNMLDFRLFRAEYVTGARGAICP